jgi:tetratricopeptide (TPR) repeat protein
MNASVIRHDRLTLRGSPLAGENPQPFFRQPDLELAGGPDFPEDKKYSFGRETGFRVLPYTMQDRYSRELVDMEFDSVVMENDFLRACFIPALGGRLWSLFDKKRKRDILYRNPLFRPANLAMRDAWFSGGIEWNIGRLGHAAHTASPVFAGTFQSDGMAVLRLWEFERQTRLFWRLEFTLPEDSTALFAYTRIENPDAADKPLYWWTNAAVPQTPGVRVFSASDEVIYIVPGTEKVKTMDGGRLPDLPVLPGVDASYPARSDYSNEYFFQNDRVCGGASLPWESAVYEDGYAYGEMSTAPLLYRKMFCWGSGRGGKRWQDFLSLPGEEYLEVQAGLAPTQLHTADIGGGAFVDWVQAFTAFDAESERSHQKDYGAARGYVEQCLARRIEPSALDAALKQARSRTGVEAEILHAGSGWGALELRRIQHVAPRTAPAMPRSLSFPDDAIGATEAPWAELLRAGALPLRPLEAGPGAFMVDENWDAILAASPAREGDWLTPYHLGVMVFERGDAEKAAAHWADSLNKAENPWACRNLAVAALKAGNAPAALDYYKRALALPGGDDPSFAEEYIPLLLAAGKTEEAAAELDACIRRVGSLEALSVPLIDAAARLAMQRGDDALLDRIFALEPAHIREGNTTLVELWFERERRRRNSGEIIPPREIDFRMYTRR